MDVPICNPPSGMLRSMDMFVYFAKHWSFCQFTNDSAMPIMPCLAALMLALLIAVTFCRKLTLDKNKPPRVPRVPGVPLLGNIFNLDRKRIHLSLTALARTFGRVYQIKILNKNIVVVNGPSEINEVLVGSGNDFAGRPNFFRISYGFHGAKDLIFGDFCDKWVYLKKIVAQSIRHYATGHREVDDIVRDEMMVLVDKFEETRAKDFDPAMLTLTAVVNAISAAVMGRRFNHDDPQMLHYKKTTRLFSQACSVSEGTELDVMPWLRFFPNESFRKLTEARDMLDKFVDEEIEIRKKSFNPDHVTCVLDSLLAANSQEGADCNGFRITQDDVRAVFIDIFVSGTFTTSVTICALLLLITHNQDIQRMLHDEIDEHVGKDRLPEGRDRSKLHLTEAAILETLRLISHVPLCLPHKALRDTTLGGYRIDRNTEILINLWNLHHDVSIWGDPWTFRPQRFLDDEGCLLPVSHPLRKCLLPFGGGRRMCLGEKLARERICLYVAAILQKFKILPPEDAPLLSCDPRDFQLGLILEPAPFNIRAEIR